MAFCSFDDSAALFDVTPVENMFITEYMLRAPGDFVKVYLYGLMLCYHRSARMTLSAMARDLDLTEEEVERALRYWARDGLVRRTGDNPPSYTFCNLKQLTLTRAQNPGEKLYNRAFVEEIERILDKQTLTAAEQGVIFDWVDVLELPEEVVLLLLQTERERSTNGRVKISYADRRAHEWAQSGVRTLEDAHRMTIISDEREKQLRRLLNRLGQRRMPSDDEKNMYSKWLDEWGFTPEAVQEACRETTKGTPTMAYLDGILLRQHQMGRHEVRTLVEGLAGEQAERAFAAEILASMGRVGIVPPKEDMEIIGEWIKNGYSREMIRRAAREIYSRNKGCSLDDVGGRLETWRAHGITSAEQVDAERARVRALNAQLREIYDAAGLEKKTNQPDRDLLCRWMGEMGMGMELVLLAAQYARGSGAPMLTIGRILGDWKQAGITNAEAAKQEHEAHVRSAGQSAPRAAAAMRGQDQLQRYTPQERRATYSAAVVDFEEEDES